jgi:chemotaxis protein methyltransferase CheR
MSEVLIWSAGCSTGEEPYSVAMALLMHMSMPKNKVKILATDINTDVINKAKNGFYSLQAMEGIPGEMRKKFFEKVNNGYYIKPVVKELVHFRRLNLMDEFPMKKRYHLILCRNVMIYFDKPTITGLVNRFSDILDIDGILFTGHSETLNGLPVKLKYIKTAVYQKPERK